MLPSKKQVQCGNDVLEIKFSVLEKLLRVTTKNKELACQTFSNTTLLWTAFAISHSSVPHQPEVIEPVWGWGKDRLQETSCLACFKFWPPPLREVSLFWHKLLPPPPKTSLWSCDVKDMSAIEAELEILLGELHIKMKGENTISFTMS